MAIVNGRPPKMTSGKKTANAAIAVIILCFKLLYLLPHFQIFDCAFGILRLHLTCKTHRSPAREPL